MNPEINTGPLSGVSAPLGALSVVEAPNNRLWLRRGVIGWWLNLTAPARPLKPASIAEQERIRKAELTSLSILAVFLLIIALVSNSLANIATAEAVVIAAIGLTAAAVFNRFGWTRTAAYLVPSIIMLSLVASLAKENAIRVIVFPLYDLFALPIVISGFIADRRAPWILMLIALFCTLYDYSYAPHELITGVGAVRFDELGYDLSIFGWWGMINRDVAILFFAAFFSWQGALSVGKALASADRADELAALHKQQQHKAEEITQTIAGFVDEIVAVFAAQANGQPTWLRARLPHDPFSPHVHFINKHLATVARLTAEQRRLQQGELAQAVQALTTLLGQVQKGFLPTSALAPGNLPDEAQAVREVASAFYALLGQVARQAAREAARKYSPGPLPGSPEPGHKGGHP